MKQFKDLLDESKAVDVSELQNSSTPWKDRIVTWMTQNKEAAQSVKAILEATDPNYTGTNFEKRKHGLDSQMTYLRKDYNIRTAKIDDKIVLLGIEKENRLIPFKNAVKYLKR